MRCGTADAVSLFGGDSNDTIKNSTVLPGTLDGGLGADVMDGGAGEDTASYANRTTGVFVDLYQSGSSGFGRPHENNTIIHVEDLIGGSGDDYLIRATGAKHFWGGAGNETLYGGRAQDKLFGGPGFDTLDGGPQADECRVQSGGGTTVNCES